MTDSTPPCFRRLAPVLALLVVTFVLVGCGEAPSPQAWYGRPQSDFARILDGLMSQIVFLAAIVFVVVEAVLFYALFRFRQRRTGEMPSQTHGNTRVEILWTIAPAVVLAFVAVPTVRAIFESYQPSREGALQVKVVGKQWWWEFQYPELGIVTANEVHFPAGTRAILSLESGDIIHGFWVPQLGGKRDVIPTRVNLLWWTAEQPGLYYSQCTQLCGTSHANMRARAIVHDQADWDNWVRSMQNANGVPQQGSAEQIHRGYQLVSSGACVGCHAIKGTSLNAHVGPDLTRFGSRTTLGAGMYPNDEAHLIRWLKNPQEAKPGNKMPNLGLSDEDAAAIAAYLLSLK